MPDKSTELSLHILEVIKQIALEKNIQLPDGYSPSMERPKKEGQGDWSTNAAMKLCKIFNARPMDLATDVATRLSAMEGIKNVQAAAPGFINITLAGSWVSDVLSSIIKAGVDYGRNDLGKGTKIQVEFVSANPTGPIHLGHGRGAAVGDIMASILSFSGWDVQREYYINDAGIQMEKLAQSVRNKYFALLGREDEAPFPVDGYPGEYVDAVADKLFVKYGASIADMQEDESLRFLRETACAEMIKMIRKDLDDFGVKFDVWFSERSLYENGQVASVIDVLKKSGHTYEKDGALWLRTSDLGDDKDRVMVKNDGVPTYFASDMAYLKNKFDRGFKKIIYVWGADHHGYIPRMKAVNKALGFGDDCLDFLLIQFVSLLRNGVPVAMSKRAGTYVTLRDVIDEVGKDAARFSFVMRKCDSHLEFDLETAKERSNDNPVFYVQYACARINSIMREASSRGIEIPSLETVNLDILSSSSEQKLVKDLSRFPDEIVKAARSYEPHKLISYALDLAESFHAFYNMNKVLGEAENVTKARLLLVQAAKIVFNNMLGLLGIDVPERM